MYQLMKLNGKNDVSIKFKQANILVEMEIENFINMQIYSYTRQISTAGQYQNIYEAVIEIFNTILDCVKNGKSITVSAWTADVIVDTFKNMLALTMSNKETLFSPRYFNAPIPEFVKDSIKECEKYLTEFVETNKKD